MASETWAALSSAKGGPHGVGEEEEEDSTQGSVATRDLGLHASSNEDCSYRCSAAC